MTTSEKRDGKIWLYGLLLLMALFLAAMAWSLVKAGRGVSRLVDRDYYSHGLHYVPGDMSGGAARLGWRAEPTYRNGRLEFRITDHSGTPVTGGTLTVTLEGEGESKSFGCGASGPGLYGTPLTLAAGSVVRANWIFRHGSDTLGGRVTVLP